MIYQDEAEANEACIKWQSRLRLADWIVKVKIAGHAEITQALSGEPAMGCVHPVTHRKEALVRLLDPKDWDAENKTFPQDHEVTLVHELLHLYFDMIYYASPLGERSYEYKLAEEQAVCSLSSSIVALKRGER